MVGRVTCRVGFRWTYPVAYPVELFDKAVAVAFSQLVGVDQPPSGLGSRLSVHVDLENALQLKKQITQSVNRQYLFP